MASEITLLLATHDGAGYLREQLDSLRAQSHDTWRLQVIDDGSRDETVAILQEYAQLDARISFTTRDSAAGATPTYFDLLDALDPATPYFGFVDQDDVWRTDRLERVIATLRRHGDDRPVLVFTDATIVDASRETIAASALSRYGYRSAGDVHLPRLLVQNGASGNTMVGNRALAELATSPVVDRSKIVAHDWWCAVVAATAGALVGLDEPTLDWRQHGSNTTGASSAWHAPESLAKIGRLRSRARDLLVPAADQAVQLQRLLGDRLAPPDVAAIEALAALAREGISRRRVARCWRHGVRLAPLPRQLALMAGV